MFALNLFAGAGGQVVSLITVPRFSQTNTCVLVSLKTLQCQPITFNASFPAANQESPDVDKWNNTVLECMSYLVIWGSHPHAYIGRLLATCKKCNYLSCCCLATNYWRTIKSHFMIIYWTLLLSWLENRLLEKKVGWKFIPSFSLKKDTLCKCWKGHFVLLTSWCRELKQHANAWLEATGTLR